MVRWLALRPRTLLHRVRKDHRLLAIQRGLPYLDCSTRVRLIAVIGLMAVSVTGRGCTGNSPATTTTVDIPLVSTTTTPIFTTTTLGANGGLRNSATVIRIFSSCTEAMDAGAAPLLRGNPEYRTALDRDSDGIACETSDAEAQRASASQSASTPIATTTTWDAPEIHRAPDVSQAM